MKSIYPNKILATFLLCFTAGLSLNSMALPQLNGISIYSELGREQFIAAVYTDTVTSDARTLILAQEEKAIEVRVLQKIYSRRFNRMWVEGIAINAGSREMTEQAQNLADFSNYMRIKLRPGDILRIERQPKEGTIIFVNGTQLGLIKDPSFFDLLLRTWIGPVPLSSDFKSELLAAGKVPDEHFERYRSVRPSKERVAAVAAALAPEALDVSQASATSTTPQSSSSSAQIAQVSSSAAKTSSSQATVAAASASSEAPVVEPVIGIVSEDELFSDEEIFDDEQSDFTFTAESLLSEQLYISKLTRWTGNYVKYPKFAIRNEQQGTVRLTVTIARSGKVMDVQFMEKSRYEQLNKAASRAVKGASPYPAVPDEIKGETFVFTVPVVFRLQ